MFTFDDPSQSPARFYLATRLSYLAIISPPSSKLCCIWRPKSCIWQTFHPRKHLLTVTAEFPSQKTINATEESGDDSDSGKVWISHLWRSLWSEASGTHKKTRKLWLKLHDHCSSMLRIIPSARARQATRRRKWENRDSIDFGDCCFTDAFALNQPLSKS